MESGSTFCGPHLDFQVTLQDGGKWEGRSGRQQGGQDLVQPTTPVSFLQNATHAKPLLCTQTLPVDAKATVDSGAEVPGMLLGPHHGRHLLENCAQGECVSHYFSLIA